MGDREGERHNSSASEQKDILVRIEYLIHAETALSEYVLDGAWIASAGAFLIRSKRTRSCAWVDMI